MALTAAVVTAGCGGTLSPLYADFRIDEPPPPSSSDSLLVAAGDSIWDQSIQERIAEALVEAGWELDEAPSDNAV